jgi:anti-sigma factor RsiW
MTCRQANKLMEHVLDGDEGEGDADELHEHLRHCDRCAGEWQIAGQVRELMRDCRPPEPEDDYFERVTASIMVRVSRAAKRPAEESPVITSMRYGPLARRGAAASFIFALGLLVGAVALSPEDSGRFVPDPNLRDVRLVPALAHAGAGTVGGLCGCPFPVESPTAGNAHQRANRHLWIPVAAPPAGERSDTDRGAPCCSPIPLPAR